MLLFIYPISIILSRNKTRLKLDQMSFLKEMKKRRLKFLGRKLLRTPSGVPFKTFSYRRRTTRNPLLTKSITRMADRRPEPLVDGKSLSSLRVVDLKQELEKRGISKSGSKKDLIDRLRTVSCLNILGLHGTVCLV